jgi:hypothetical protein
LIKSSLPFKRRILTAARDLFAGFRYHYPICCILNFYVDTVLDRPSVQLRWSDVTDHVECFLHAKIHGKKSIPENLY